MFSAGFPFVKAWIQQFFQPFGPSQWQMSRYSYISFVFFSWIVSWSICSTMYFTFCQIQNRSLSNWFEFWHHVIGTSRAIMCRQFGAQHLQATYICQNFHLNFIFSELLFDREGIPTCPEKLPQWGGRGWRAGPYRIFCPFVISFSQFGFTCFT